MSMGNDAPPPAGGPRTVGPPLIFLGVLRVILGFLAIMAPLIAGLAIEIIVGVLVLLGGIGAVVNAFRVRPWETGLFVGLAGALAIVCGILLLLHPLAGLSFLTMLLAVYFILEGATALALAFRLSSAGARGALWAGLSGVLSLLLGILIWAQWPLSGVWAVGTLVGINLLFTGWTAIALGLQTRGSPT
jgi:uncharacterized membrane protein HdeD (DUF308 family)